MTPGAPSERSTQQGALRGAGEVASDNPTVAGRIPATAQPGQAAEQPVRVPSERRSGDERRVEARFVGVAPDGSTKHIRYAGRLGRIATNTRSGSDRRVTPADASENARHRDWALAAVEEAPAEVTPRYADWEVRPDEDGVDEILGTGWLHMERLDDRLWWFGFYVSRADGSRERLTWTVSPDGCQLIEYPADAPEPLRSIAKALADGPERAAPPERTEAPK